MGTASEPNLSIFLRRLLGVRFVLSFWETELMVLITFAKAIEWICTRDHEAVLKVAEDSDDNPLAVAMQRYRYEYSLPPGFWRETLDGSSHPGKLVVVGKYASSQQALTGLSKSIFGRHMPLYVFGAEGKYRSLQDMELHDVEIRLCDDGRASCGLWSRTLERFIFVEPKVDLADLQRLWPGIVVPRSIQVIKRILESLEKATENSRRLKKEEAMVLVMNVEGYGRRCFEEAWKQLDSGRKYGRGQRGPGKKAA
jgi:hypothetical protein